jgi:hypothetical protein
MRARRVAVAGAVLLAAVALQTGWDLYRIRADLRAGRHDLASLTLETAGDPGVAVVARDARAHLRSAAARARSSVGLRLLSPVPGAARQVAALRHLTAETASLGDDAVAAATTVDRALDGAGRPAGRLRALDVADRQMATLDERLRSVELGDDSGLIGPIRRAQSELRDDLEASRRSLRRGRRDLAPVRRLLEGPSTLLLLAANNAEMAGGSGLALSASVLTIDQGDMTLGEVVPASELLAPQGVPLPPEIGRLYSPTGVGVDLRSTTRSPDLSVMGPVAAAIMAGHGVPHLDGIVVVDAVALADVMRVTGAVRVGALHLGPDDVLRTVLHDTYRYFDATGDHAARQDLQGEIARAVVDAITTRAVSAPELTGALSSAARGRHLILWGADPALQRSWESLGLAGSLAPDGLLVSFQNYGADKLDWYLHPKATLDVARLPSGDFRARLHLSLAMPSRDALRDASPYILGPGGGTHGLFVTVHLPGRATHITTTDHRGFRTKGAEGPMQVRTFLSEVRAGEAFERTIDFTLPGSMTTMTLLPSARVTPMPLTVDGLATIDDATPVTFSWRSAGPPPAPRPPLWAEALGVFTLTLLLTLVGPGLLASLRRRIVGGPSGLGDGASVGTSGEAGVLGEDPGGVAGFGQLPLGPPLGEGGLVDEQVDGVLDDVDDDPVALGHERDGSAVDGLGCHVADAEAVRAP